MSTENSIRPEVSNDEQTVTEETAVVEESELRPSVEQEIQGTVDTKHFEAAGRGLTLEAEERLAHSRYNG